MSNNEKKQLIWRMINLYRGSEAIKMPKIQQKYAQAIIGDTGNINDVIVEFIIPSIDLKASSLSGTVFVGINPIYKEQVFRLFAQDKSVFHQENLPSLEENTVLKLKSKVNKIQSDPLNQFDVGDQIQVIKGDYSGMTGKIIKKHDKEVSVSIWMMGEEQIIKSKVGEFELIK